MKYNVLKPNYLDILNKYHLNSLLSKVLAMHDYDDATIQSLMNPRLVYHDFSLFEEADMTLDRIEEAILEGEKICIYGDYDCDGILATTILVQAFLQRGVHVGYHIPNRFEDGYGLNASRVRQMAEKGYTLIITVDNGVKAFEAVECANELGVDVIITDHHQFDNDLPDACSFIHTKLSPEYPFKEISGGFVAYKLATALLHKQDKYLYCLAAITTISDMMPLLDENRSLVKKALEFMTQEKYPSLELLLGSQQKYSVSSIGFTIAPKINSFGRLPEICHPNILVKYFLKDAPQQMMMKVAQKAQEVNTKRQTLTNQQYSAASGFEDQSFMYWSSPDVHEGIIGLIAGKYTHQYEKPSFVMHYDQQSGVYKGSARSVNGFSLHEFFNEHQDQLLTCGGHALAGGFSVDEAHYESFKHCIEEALVNKHLESVEDVLWIEEEDLSIPYIESLSLLEPFGMGNKEPFMMLSHAPVKQILSLSEGKHLKFVIEYKNVKIFGLYFHQGHRLEEFREKKVFDLIGQLSINEFRNQKSINLIIKDIL